MEQARPLIERFDLHLVGGTGLAWHLGHRRSLDLDLFSATQTDFVESLLLLLPRLGVECHVVDSGPVTLKLLVAGVPVDIVEYPYPLLWPTVPGPASVPVASVVDIGTMKLSAIATRGIARDFWDLWEIIAAGQDLKSLLNAYVKRFGTGRDDLYHVLRALTWFDDADAPDELPSGLNTAQWLRIKDDFRRAVPAVMRQLLADM